jgi:hypothetical protein
MNDTGGVTNDTGSKTGAGGAINTGGTTATTTTAAAPPVGPWTFDTSPIPTEWSVNSNTPYMTASWVAEGEAEPLGSMRLDNIGQLADIARNYAAKPLDLSAFRINYRLRTVTGTVNVKPFAFASGNWIWADGGTVTVTDTWVTAGFTFSAPSYAGVDTSGNEYSPSAIVAIGIQVEATSAIAVLVDRIWLDPI